MRMTAWILLGLAAALSAGGCRDVVLTRKYSTLLDFAAEISERDAGRALAGEMSPDQMTAILVFQSGFLTRLRDARDGRERCAKPK